MVEQPIDKDEDSNSNDEMSEDEFERLLDELHGSGSVAAVSPPVEKVSESPANSITDASSDEISDDEFESLLDELHGQGAFSVDATATENSTLNTASDDIDDLGV